jgi:hypothetical protein
MKIKNILSIVALSILFVGCSNEDVTREPSPAANPSSTNVYFSPTNISNPVLGIKQDTFSIKIGRKVTTGAQTVAITLENTYGDTIQAPSEVSFKAGDSIAKAVITTKGLVLMKKYHVAIAIDQKQTKPYTPQSVYPRIELIILKEDYAPYAEGTFTSNFFEAQWDQTLEYSPATTTYRFKDLYATGYNYLFKVDDKGVITQSPNAKVATGYVDDTYGMISILANPAKSKFDAATSTYTFYATFTVSAGSFGAYPETYTITKKY